MQGKVQTQTKSRNAGASTPQEEAWIANDVFSEVDVTSEKRLLEFCRREFGAPPFLSVISEELNAENSPSGTGEFTLVIDPLDGTKPYLEGKKGFGISLGVMQGGRFVFGVNHYPALETLYYAFTDSPGVMDIHGDLIPPPKNWKKECYVAVGFETLLDERHRHEGGHGAIEAVTGVRVGDYDRSATYIFKRLIEGASCAYLSIEPYIWDLGPSSLLLEKAGCGMIDLTGRAVDFEWLSRPPFCQPAVVALPLAKKEFFLDRLQPILEPSP